MREEVRAPPPYACINHATTSQLCQTVVKAASLCRDDRVAAVTVKIFSTLVDTDLEEFIYSRGFARSLMRFSMRLLDGNQATMHDTEAELVEVLFSIAAKIRLEIDLLGTWFAPHGRAGDEAAEAEVRNFTGTTQKDDFPLCYLFIDRVHYEGRIGDFSRTGLLYIFEVASKSEILDSWIIASDLPTLMASALGALYSQLDRELSLRHDDDELPMILSLSDYIDMSEDRSMDTIHSKSHKSHMSTFLSDLSFWQDILEHCTSMTIRETLLDHFQVLFLRQVLYPSLLESSDSDGSSVAVLTYLHYILQTLTDRTLVDSILSYLLGTNSKIQTPISTRKHSSVVLAISEDALEPNLFNLVDLIHNGFQSKSAQTVSASLQLFTTIITQHKTHALGVLVRLNAGRDSRSTRCLRALQADAEDFMDLARSIAQNDDLDDAFSYASYDVEKLLEMTALRHAQTNKAIDARNNSVIFDELQKPVNVRSMSMHDTGVKAIIVLVKSFLVNGVDVNLALTETIMALASCITIDTVDFIAARSDSTVDSATDGDALSLSKWLDDDEMTLLRKAVRSRALITQTSDRPVLWIALSQIIEQITMVRQQVTRFDALLSKRRSILQPPRRADDLFTTPAKKRISRLAELNSSPLHQTDSRNISPSIAIGSNMTGSSISIPHTPQRSTAISPSSPTSSTSTIRGRQLSNGTTNITPAIPTALISTSTVQATVLPIHSSRERNSPRASSGPAHSPAHKSLLNAGIRRSSTAESSDDRPRMASLFNNPYTNKVGSQNATTLFASSPFASSQGGKNNDGISGDVFTATNDGETLMIKIGFDHHGRVINIDGQSITPTLSSDSIGNVDLDGINESRLSLDDTSDESVDKESDKTRINKEIRIVTLSHVLTNIVVLQNFVLELVAVIQLRGKLYEGEVDF